MYIFPVLILCLVVQCFLGSPLVKPLSAEQSNMVILQGLDKVTARVYRIPLKFDVPIEFGTLIVTARACEKKPPEEPPESTAFLEIRESIDATDNRLLFSGWMFASAPGISALEHPVYDVWVLDCVVAR